MLDGVLERAMAYQAPQLCTILGNQGTGKSRLLSEWLGRVKARPEGVRVYRGRASERRGSRRDRRRASTLERATAMFSSSIELIHSPPDLIMSFERSVIVR